MLILLAGMSVLGKQTLRRLGRDFDQWVAPWFQDENDGIEVVTPDEEVGSFSSK